MKLLTLCLVLAACSQGRLEVPAAYRAMVPTDKLDRVTERDEATAKLYYGGAAGLEVFYDHADAPSVQRAFADKLAALDGYQPLVACGDTGGFDLAVMKPGGELIEVEAEVYGELVKATLSTATFEMYGLPKAPGCAWLPAAQTLCDLSQAPDECHVR